MKTFGHRQFGKWLMEYDAQCPCGLAPQGPHVHVTGPSAQTHTLTHTTPSRIYGMCRSWQEVPMCVCKKAVAKMRRLEAMK